MLYISNDSLFNLMMNKNSQCYLLSATYYAYYRKKNHTSAVDLSTLKQPLSQPHLIVPTFHLGKRKEERKKERMKE